LGDPGRGRVLNRVRGAVLFFALCKTFFKTLANVVGDRGFLEPGLNIGECLVRKAKFGEEDAGRRVGCRIVTVAREKIGKNIFFTGKILDLEVVLGESFPPSAKTAIM